ncbi:MAG: translational GTPase TypA [marine benthic group bacterium]|nr:translational GTPase TypA [Gemmatimonadota bacterium]
MERRNLRVDSIRNIAIIAHVDHGKTTLVDQLLQQAGVFRTGQQVQERVMDSNPLERERGITIFSKNAAVRWKADDGSPVKINLVDTPGHADFGGEVERILRMVDGCLLLVDAFEGPMPQTRFVTRKALELGLHPVIVINKVDRTDADPERVHDEVLDLLIELEASDEQLDAPFLYASAREGWASADPSARAGTLAPLFDTVVRTVPPPHGAHDGSFHMLVSTLDYSPYLGRMAIGRIEHGSLRVGDPVAVWPLDADEPGETVKVPTLFAFESLGRTEIEEAVAGEIVAVAGVEGAEIGATLCDPESPLRLEGIAVEPPTLSVEMRANTSPFSGQSGKYVTSRQIRERLFREAQSNVALRVEETEEPDRLRVSGRGELHLAILMETMRREGYEFSVSRPHVITRPGADGKIEEPYEEVVADVPESMVGVVMQGLGERKGEMTDMEKGDGGLARLHFLVPSRALTGYRSEFLTETRGEGTLHRQFAKYGPWAGEIESRKNGALVSMIGGTASGYSLFNLQERGKLFVEPGDDVYDGMVVGEHARENDLEVNVTKGKKLTNIRAAGSDENILLEPAREVTLEFGLEFIVEDELLEVTPDAIRVRKRSLNTHDRKRDRKTIEARAVAGRAE